MKACLFLFIACLNFALAAQSTKEPRRTAEEGFEALIERGLKMPSGDFALGDEEERKALAERVLKMPSGDTAYVGESCYDADVECETGLTCVGGFVCLPGECIGGAIAELIQSVGPDQEDPHELLAERDADEGNFLNMMSNKYEEPLNEFGTNVAQCPGMATLLYGENDGGLRKLQFGLIPYFAIVWEASLLVKASLTQMTTFGGASFIDECIFGGIGAGLDVSFALGVAFTSDVTRIPGFSIAIDADVAIGLGAGVEFSIGYQDDGRTVYSINVSVGVGLGVDLFTLQLCNAEPYVPEDDDDSGFPDRRLERYVGKAKKKKNLAEMTK